MDTSALLPEVYNLTDASNDLLSRLAAASVGTPGQPQTFTESLETSDSDVDRLGSSGFFDLPLK